MKRSNDVNDSSEDEEPKKKYESKKKTFSLNWLDMPEFKEWIATIPGDLKSRCKCTACNKTLTCGKTELQRHASTEIHIKNIRLRKSTPRLDTLFQAETAEKLKNVTHKNKISTAEIVISSYFAQHNIAFQNVEPMIDMLKNVITDSKILADIHLKRNKCTSIVTNVIAPVETDELTNILQKEKFSILIDESTDVSTKKLLCLLVQYIHPTTKKQQVKLLELLEIDAKDGTAEAIYGTVKMYFDSKNILLTNIVGLACDGASVMVGKHNSFYSRLMSDVPHVLLLKCICHSAAIISSKGCSKLPTELEELMKAVYSYVGGSSKRCDQLQEMQDYFGLKHYKILKLSGTRWLSAHQCIERLLINWDVLIAFFDIAVFEDNLSSAKFIQSQLGSTTIKCYFLFLKFTLNSMNQFNALFQSKLILIPTLQNESIKLYLKFCQNFIKPQLLKQEYLGSNIIQPNNYLPLEDIHVGSDCEATMTSLSSGEQHEIRLRMLGFYVCIAEEIRSRLPLCSPIFSEFEFVLPQNAFSTTRSKNLIRLDAIATHYTNFIDISCFHDEWRTLPYQFNENEKEKLVQLPLPEMWYILKDTKDFTGNFLFFNLATAALIVLTLPHSNAEAERVFSVVNDVKTKKRNRLGINTLNSICVVRSSFSADNTNCTNFKPDERHVQLFNSKMYKK